MKLLNSMECADYKGGKRNYVSSEDGSVNVLNFDFDFGVSINIILVDMPCFSTEYQETEVNYIGTLMCVTGSVENTVGDDVFTQLPCTAVFGRPDPKPNYLRFPGGKFKGISIGFTPEANLPKIGHDPDIRFMLAALKERYDTKNHIPFIMPNELMIVADSLIIELIDNGMSDQRFFKQRCAEALHILYCMGKPTFPCIPQMKNAEIVDRMCYDLLDDLSTTPNIKQLCEDNDVNEFWFIRNFKKRYGFTPYEYHKIAKLTFAAAMLMSNDKQIGEVAKKTGYASQSKFSMAFKEFHECRPKHFTRCFETKLLDCQTDDLFD